MMRKPIETVHLGAGGVNQQSTACQNSVASAVLCLAKNCKMQTGVETKPGYRKKLLGRNIWPLFVWLAGALPVNSPQ